MAGILTTPVTVLRLSTTALDSFYSGSTVLVTGASSGFGAAFAERLGSLGARVLLVTRSPDKLTAVAKRIREHGGEAVLIASDLGVGGAAADLVARLEEQGETVDVLINTSAYGIQGQIMDTPLEDVEHMGMLNTVSLTSLTRQLVPGMIERGHGGVLNLGSISGFVPAPGLAIFAATKAYVLSFTDALHAELQDTGVHVTGLYPGIVRMDSGRRTVGNPLFVANKQSVNRIIEAGLVGLAANRGRVVPSWTYKLLAMASGWVPNRLGLRMTRSILQHA